MIRATSLARDSRSSLASIVFTKRHLFRYFHPSKAVAVVFLVVPVVVRVTPWLRLTTVLLELPIPVVQGADRSGLEPS